MCQMQTPAEAFDCVLIDDEEVLRCTWQVAAQQAGVRLLALDGAEAFWQHAPKLARTIPIYVDHHLKGKLTGEYLSKQMAAAGFTEIYLHTGSALSAHRLASRPWIKGVVKKEPP